jgi:TRAP-type C4-dicarboxylate transport system permease small subunit
MMAVTTTDVVGRYLLNRPLGGAFEITEIAMALVIFAGLALAAAAREHITVNLLEARLPPAVRRWQAVAGDLVCAAVMAGLTWRIAVRGAFLASTGEKLLVTGVPRGYVASAMAALAALVVVAFLAAAWRAARRAPRAVEGPEASVL